MITLYLRRIVDSILLIMVGITALYGDVGSAIAGI
jgi:hypothetical protein